MSEQEDELRQAGLSGNESKVYYQLLQHGSTTANAIAHSLSMDRTLSYAVLNKLIEKGLVTYVIRQKKKYFQATDPANLLNGIRAQELFIKELIPKLKQIESTQQTALSVELYEGRDGIRAVMNKALIHKNWVSYGATGRTYDWLYETPHIIQQLQKAKTLGRIITSSAYKTHPMTQLSIAETRYVDATSEATTVIFGEYVGIFLLKDKPLITLIKNPLIAQGYRNYFEVLWKAAKPLSKM